MEPVEHHNYTREALLKEIGLQMSEKPNATLLYMDPYIWRHIFYPWLIAQTGYAGAWMGRDKYTYYFQGLEVRFKEWGLDVE